MAQTDCRTTPMAGTHAAVGVLCLLGAVAVLVTGGLWLCPSDACRVPAIDSAVLAAAHAAQGPTLNAFAAGTTWFGSLFVLAPLCLLAAGVGRVCRRPREGLLPLLSLAGAALLGQLVKEWLDRPRPALFDAIVRLPGSPSFPSGHTIQASAALLALALLLPPRQRRAGVVAALALAAVVGATRVHLQVHYPTDVALGLAAGGLWSIGVWRLLQARP
ncbi:MAG: phosphatase PAP2 family protein [Rhodocyclaceae bacterium]|nr:phosphatase PAP2 family protein [Rhodocyclaceae bacterium]